MLRKHLETWESYPASVRAAMQLIIVDDGSPEPAEPIVREREDVREVWLQLYRIKTDIPWNRGGARNLGSYVAETPWLLHMDIDHLLPFDEGCKLANSVSPNVIYNTKKLSPDYWYRFERWRVGAADETRNKDAIPRDAKFGKIKPHGDSFIVPRELYWKVGGYNENFSGCLGGGSPFLKQLEAAAPHGVLPIALHVYTRDACPDASVSTLSRDTSEYVRRRRAMEKAGTLKGINPLRFEWERVL